MSPIVYRISVLLGAILADVPVGTNLGAVLAALGADLWSIPAPSRCRLPGAGRRGTAGRGRAPLWSGAGVWTLGHRDPPTGRPGRPQCSHPATPSLNAGGS